MTESAPVDQGRLRGGIALATGPAAALLSWLLLDDPAMAAAAALFALAGGWWISEALHPAQTALVVIALAPILGACSAKQAFGALGNPILFLFVGSFMVAEAMRLHGLGDRIATFMTRRIGSELGALAATSSSAFLLSMWISNSASTAIVLPIALSVARASSPSFRSAIVLAVAWAASMGGLCTPVGTPPNLIAVRALAERGVDLSFVRFLTVGTPIGVVMLLAMIAVLALRFGVRRTPLPPQSTTTKAWSRGEIAAASAFGLAVVGWVVPGLLQLLELPGATVVKTRLSEEVVAILAAGVLFLWPIHRRGEPSRRALSWDDAVGIDWGTVILFGAGVLLGELANSSGLAHAWGTALMEVSGAASTLAVLALVVVAAVILSEVASNTAAATLVIPVGLGLADVTGTSVIAVTLAGALASSFGFMMPISTAPNAMAFGTGQVTMRQMVTTGFVFDIVGAVVVVAGVLVLCG
jgi:solute carrier family 13 (sodium-dependent dicarboxylate transporter), member 2/3/5